MNVEENRRERWKKIKEYEEIKKKRKREWIKELN